MNTKGMSLLMFFMCAASCIVGKGKSAKPAMILNGVVIATGLGFYAAGSVGQRENRCEDNREYCLDFNINEGKVFGVLLLVSGVLGLLLTSANADKPFRPGMEIPIRPDEKTLQNSFNDALPKPNPSLDTEGHL